ncbi:MAG: biosynthetic-type acetolactate synthase large subunit [Clostridia bacterium]|nr:biosynthetic-type acetolactate synthase large subunit [Clostridia bacterium]
MKLNGSQILMETLVEQGVDVIFGYPGGAVLNIYDALYDYQDKIKHVLTAHEQGATHAADGYARVTGKAGVVIATSGPGATNLVTGIANAYMDSVPMVCITGNVSQELIGRDSFQEVYITGITLPITKHNIMVRDVNELADAVRKAFRIANSGRKGPVLIDIPKDVSAAIGEFTPREVLPLRPLPKAEDWEIEKIAQMIKEAQRPLIYFGGGVVFANAQEALYSLMKKCDIPACNTLMSTGQIEDDERLKLGMVGMHGSVVANMAVENCDLLLALGVRFSDRVALNAKRFARNARIVHVDIDTTELNKNVSVDLEVIADVRSTLESLLPMVEEKKHEEWLEAVKIWKEESKPCLATNDGLLHPYGIIDLLHEEFGKDTIWVTDVGQHQMWVGQRCRHINPRSFVTSGGLGTMGFGYGAAIGSKVAAPARPVLHITSDGSLHMNLNEACTAVSQKLPVITVIFNNEVLGMVRQWQRTFYHDRFMSVEPERQTNYVKLIEAFGGKGYICHNMEELKQAVKEAKQATGPVWIDCRISRDERVLPMIPSGGTVENMIIE